MLASDPAGILDQIFGRAGIHLTQESTQDDHALYQRYGFPHVWRERSGKAGLPLSQAARQQVAFTFQHRVSSGGDEVGVDPL